MLTAAARAAVVDEPWPGPRPHPGWGSSLPPSAMTLPEKVAWDGVCVTIADAARAAGASAPTRLRKRARRGR